MTIERRVEIIDMVNTIIKEYNLSIPIQLETIAKQENIYYGFHPYDRKFDGVLSYWDGCFYILMNTWNNEPDTGRARFTFAHEIGHYFIDEHRNELINNTLYHLSKSEYKNTDSLIEKEADYFAACLLMPEEHFRISCSKPFCPSLIETLSFKFKTSILATLIRYIELDLFKLFVVYIKNGLVVGVKHSHDFPYNYKDFREKAPPKGSIVYELGFNDYTSEEPNLIDKELWFNYRNKSMYDEENEDENEEYELLEYSYRINKSLIINVIWEDNN